MPDLDVRVEVVAWPWEAQVMELRARTEAGAHSCLRWAEEAQTGSNIPRFRKLEPRVEVSKPTLPENLKTPQFPLTMTTRRLKTPPLLKPPLALPPAERGCGGLRELKRSFDLSAPIRMIYLEKKR